MDRARKFAYAILVVSVAVVAQIIPSASQTVDQNWARCEDNNPDLSIGGCTLVIQSGQETDENLATAFYNRGNAYDNKGQYDLAIADYNEAIRLNPDYYAAFYNRGNAYEDNGQYDLAIADYSEAIRLKPDDPLAFYNRGIAKLKTGDTTGGNADIAQAKTLGYTPQ